MGRSLQRNDTFSEQSYPGCIAGILRILDYHHWHVKRLLPHKKNAGRKRNRNAKVIMESRDLGEALIDADSDSLLVEHQTDNSARTGKTRSNFSSEDDHGSWVLSFPLESWLQRANSVQCLEPSETRCNDFDTDEESPAPKRDAKNDLKNSSVDVLEIFKVNKEFFMKILQDPKGRGNQKYFHGLKNSNIKVRLGKSKSFPMAQPPKARHARPSTIEQKQNEVLLFLNKEEAPAEGSTRSSGSHGWNQMVVKRFRDIKRKIKRALKESKREECAEKEEEEESSVEAIEILEGLEVTVEDDDGVRKPRVHRGMRRTSSLTESVDRYTSLFDDDVSVKSATKYTKSRSLSLSSTSEEEKLLPSWTRKSYRRNLSLPDLDSLSSFLNAPRLSMSMERNQSLTNIDEERNEIGALCSDDDTRHEACIASYPRDGGEIEPDIKPCFSNRSSMREGSKLGTESRDLVFARQILELLTFKGDEEAAAFRDEISAQSSCEAEQHHCGLLFDLVNEAVVEMSERLYCYFPRREKEGLTEEIWAGVRWYTGLRPELDSSLDDVVARDLATEKGGDWKSSEWEKEMVALEIEDLVFDQLLDELLCSLD